MTDEPFHRGSAKRSKKIVLLIFFTEIKKLVLPRKVKRCGVDVGSGGSDQPPSVVAHSEVAQGQLSRLGQCPSSPLGSFICRKET